MNPKFAQTLLTVEAEALTWMAVHGNLCLALRHPDNRGASRPRMIGIIKVIGALLIESGLLTQSELDDAMRYEQQQGNRIQ